MTTCIFHSYPNSTWLITFPVPFFVQYFVWLIKSLPTLLWSIGENIFNSSLILQSHPTLMTINYTWNTSSDPPILSLLPHWCIISYLFSAPVSQSVPLTIALPPPQTIPCTVARMIFLKHGTNPMWQHQGVVQNLHSRACVETWFRHLLPVLSWQCYLTYLCFTLLRS